MRNYFTFDGIDSRSFGVYISGQGTFKAPARSYDAIEIPGKNGALLGIDSRLGNVELTYPAFIYSNFAENIAAFRAFLLSHKGYFKLKDSYHPDEFRLAYYPGPFEPDVTSANNAGSFDITFICKPQRYLESGQELVELSPSTAQVETYTGNIAEIEPGIGDRVTGLAVPFIPIQDLHGYSDPWPAGGGKNKLPNKILKENAYRMQLGIDNISDWIPLKAGTYKVSVGYASGVTGTSIFWKTPTESAHENSTITLSQDDTVHIWIFKDGLQTSDVLWWQCEAGSTATAYAPYENICPITGRTGLSVYRTGKNLIDITLSQHNVNTLKTNVFSLPKGTFAISVGSSITLGGMYLRSGSTLSAPVIAQIYNSNTLTVTLTEAYSELILQLYKGTGLPVSDIEYVQIEAGSATAYESYNGNTYSSDWTSEAGTVYGGTLDVVTGLLTVTHGIQDLGDLDWTYQSGSTRFFSSGISASVKAPSSNGAVIDALCSQYKYMSLDSLGIASIGCAVSNTKNVYIKNTAYTDPNALKTALSGVQFVYELATPITYQLTPQDITLIQNALNYIWSNAGPVTVEVTEGLRVTNPTLFDALPFLRVYGTGILGIGSHTITITAADVYTDIDCEMMDCFKGSANKNQYVQFSGNDFPTLKPGVNGFTFSGITKVEVKPRWWSV